MSPEAVQLAAVGLFVLVARFYALRTRAGGVILALALATAIGFGATHPTIGPRLADPERLPAAIFAVAAIAVTWWGLHREAVRRVLVAGGSDASARSENTPADAALVTVSGVTISGVTAAVVVAAIVVAAIVVAAIVRPAPPPGPTELSVPWFLAGLLEIETVLSAGVARVVLPVIVVLALFAAPWLDTRDRESEGARRDEVPFFLFAWAALGWGPMIGRVFFRDAPPTPAPPLSTRLFVDLLAVPPPSSLLLRELPGLLLLATLFGVLPFWLVRWRASRGVFERHRRRLGALRYHLVMALATLVALVPLATAMRLFFGVGPWIHGSPGGPGP